MNENEIKEGFFDNIEEAIEDFKAGKMLIVADDENRENEGDLICCAQKVTPEIINFMATECKGLICLAIDDETAKRLELSQMVEKNTESANTAFTQSIDGAAKFGVTTGISAFDRAKTIQIAIDKNSRPNDLRRPGHIFPCVAKKGGVLERTGHTETSVDLAKIAGQAPAGVMCEILNPDGTMARRDELRKFADKYNIKFITVEQLISYRIKKEKFVTREAQATLPTQFGDFKVLGYLNNLTQEEHVALVKDDGSDKIPLIRVHSECLTGDVFHSLKCDCNSQLHRAMKMVDDWGRGAIIYIRNHEGRGIGLINKIKAYSLQEKGQDTIEANISLGFEPDLRDYGVGAQIILDLGYNNFNLITNNPKKIVGLKGYDLKIHEIVNLEPDLNCYNQKYMATKKEKMHHMM
ncbi:MAG TPA: bifunctional 3,4-dihydroxy-2-butanone-4-phosphate synthase/GTP cyclohydrolase II [Candidatus Gastranaerophilaceae bacterium]|nr:bifunctional 3,4-dihydroxy-2-butanone-4-phosphate synthase/GTP cyclohydrolase II [Candidatus Gastranaerophilaceae bacterium]HPT41225.1 bifunctional 3,4-dihydroxy-2-butanone-4-phosphate synthase/GTP cyclohydrolase II [Candidatus Gastranaerophilaceae bacterium]